MANGDRPTTPEWPVNDRHDPGIKQAFMIGAVACENCRQVHVDLVGADGVIFASGSLDFERWVDMALGVVDDVKRIEGQH